VQKFAVELAGSSLYNIIFGWATKQSWQQLQKFTVAWPS
jgi:hypothetical protein